MGIELPNGEKIVHDRVRSQALDEPFPECATVLSSQAHVSHVCRLTAVYQDRLIPTKYSGRKRMRKRYERMRTAQLCARAASPRPTCPQSGPTTSARSANLPRHSHLLNHHPHRCRHRRLCRDVCFLSAVSLTNRSKRLLLSHQQTKVQKLNG
jgi:hypothetical protein